MKRCFELRNGDRLVCTEKDAVFTFSGQRAVLSTGANGGGLRYDLTAAFNHCDCSKAGICQPMEGATLQEHQIGIARRLGLDPEHTTGLDTAANLDNMVVVTKSSGALWVTAAVSGGADVNALCAGDPAALTEENGAPCPVQPGTINIFLVTDRALAPGAMAELMVTATEAKTALLRDWMVGSSVSRALATGTGTDGMVIICGTEPEKRLLNGGKHFKIGELAALAVQEAVSEALLRQTGLCPQSQRLVLRRLGRFGITAASLSAHCQREVPEQSAAFSRTIEHLDRDSFLGSAVALYVHLMDQRETGLLTQYEAEDWATFLLEEIQRHYGCSVSIEKGVSLPARMEQLLAGLLVINLREQRRFYPTEAPL